ncbi:hypothetical protein I7I53_00754 [Histoplasma capsulatum var. duboisii H88]|uniref:Uncharacterized protein n=1 Tax=Ajellomyces capsulatus (strain H88) TaxID=544711 RepID=A0A8A1LJ33_AJEC8|nr:hypothetical protein I7I53_00754 [Histoplasma capsulatum var. duboisii H88]
MGSKRPPKPCLKGFTEELRGIELLYVSRASECPKSKCNMPQRMSYRGLSYGVFQFVESLCPEYTFLDSSHPLKIPWKVVLI